MKELIGRKVKDLETGRTCEVTNSTATSVEILRLKNLDFYNIECRCDWCKKNSIIEKGSKMRCGVCKGKLTEVMKNYTGVDCLSWYEKSWFDRKFEVIK